MSPPNKPAKPKPKKQGKKRPVPPKLSGTAPSLPGSDRVEDGNTGGTTRR